MGAQGDEKKVEGGISWAAYRGLRKLRPQKAAIKLGLDQTATAAKPGKLA